MTHLRCFALEALMQGNKRLRHSIGTVTNEQLASQQPSRKELVFEALLMKDAEEIVVRDFQRSERGQLLRGTCRIRRHKIVHVENSALNYAAVNSVSLQFPSLTTSCN